MDFHKIYGTGRLWTRKELVKFWKVRVTAIWMARLPLADNDSVPISMWRGRGVRSTEYPLVVK